MTTDIKLSKAQISRIMKSGEFLGKMLGKLGKKNIVRPCYSFA